MGHVFVSYVSLNSQTSFYLIILYISSNFLMEIHQATTWQSWGGGTRSISIIKFEKREKKKERSNEESFW